MKKIASVFAVILLMSFMFKAQAQIDLNNLNLQDLLGKVLNVKKGFAPTFSLAGTPISKISKVAEILGMKKDDDINRLFKTFQTGRIIYKVGAFAGGAIAAYSLIRKMDKSVKSGNYNAALYSGVGSIASGLIVKFLTKGASYQAVDIFNGIAINKIKKIFSLGPSSDSYGIGLYVNLD